MITKRIGTIGGAAAAVIGGLSLNQRVGAVPVTLNGIANFQESSTLTNSGYFTTNTTPGSQSFPYILSRHYTNSGAYEYVPFIKISLSSIPAGSQVTGAHLGLYYTDSTYWGGAAVRQDYIDLWSVKDAFDPASVNMTTYDGSHAWTDGFDAGVDGGARTGPAGSFLSTIWPTTNTPAGTPSSGQNNNVQEYKIFSSDQLDNYLTTQINAPGGPKDAYLELTNSNNNGDGVRFVATSDVNNYGAIFDNQPYLTFEQSALVSKWRKNDNGLWSDAVNWFGQVVPNGVGVSAELGSWTDVANISYPNGSITVDIGGGATVGHLTFDTAETYNLTGTGALTMDVSSGSATIDVLNGSQVISAPLVLNKDTTINVAANAPSLVVSGDISAAAGVTVTKAGGGFLEVKNLRGVGLAVNSGKVTITPDGGANGVSKLTSVAVETAVGGGILDLTNNKLITSSPVGTWNGSSYSDVTGLIASGRNGGAWNGNGIVTSMSDAASPSILTTLAIASAADVESISGGQTALFAGQTVTASDTLVMYTYAGDANLDGRINGDDYFAIDSNVNTAGASGYAHGDFNYDGRVNGDDYFLIDSNINQQSLGVFSSSLPAAVAAVPEPASLGLIMLAAATLTRRRRMR